MGTNPLTSCASLSLSPAGASRAPGALGDEIHGDQLPGTQSKEKGWSGGGRGQMENIPYIHPPPMLPQADPSAGGPRPPQKGHRKYVPGPSGDPLQRALWDMGILPLLSRLPAQPRWAWAVLSSASSTSPPAEELVCFFFLTPSE